MRLIVTLLTALLLVHEGQAQVLRVVYVDTSALKLIPEHLEKIQNSGWAEVTPGDLHHGHLLLPTDIPLERVFDSPEALLSVAVGMLYHSDEQLRRWLLTDGNLPVERRRPRSIVGWPDGSVVSAKKLITELWRLENYERSGSITTDDLARLAREELEPLAHRRDWHAMTTQGLCRFNLQFDINPYHGVDSVPTISVGGQAFRVTMDCWPPRRLD